LSASKPLRVLCTREVQKSLKDSVYKLLCDQIKKLGLENSFKILANEIRGTCGSQFIFAGLSDLTVESIKSFEAIDITWIEEGQAMSKRSWEILIPTIRKDGSEIWVTYNPELETDETHKRLTLNPPDDCICVEMNWRDNPWFNAVLGKERLHCLATDPEGYKNIWEGKCKPAVEGAIYYNEVASAEANGQICDIPYDPALKVHVVFDLGWNDAMAISLVQRCRSEIRILEYIEDSHKTLDVYSEELKTRPYNWGKVFLPHDGFSGDIKTGKSSAEVLRALGWSVPPREDIVELGLEEGLKATRAAFKSVYFNKDGTSRLVECLKRYRRAIVQRTQEAGAPLHDQFSHGADNFRYVCINAEKMTNESTELFRRDHLRFADIRPNTINVYILGHRERGDDTTAIVVIAVDAARNKYLLDGYCHNMDLQARWLALSQLRKQWQRQDGVQSVYIGFDRRALHADLDYFEERMQVTNDAFPIQELIWPKEGQGEAAERIKRLVPDFAAGRFYLIATAENDTANQRKMKEQGQPWRCLSPVKKKDHVGALYPINKRFLDEYLMFPHSVSSVFLDACSRLYDADYVPPIIVDQRMLEPECE
jgi:phage terminase large subunit